ncbi:hypothetical protein [Sphingopyxis sp. JAI128]|uniref:hypothetical protein n=1 Tax=Sphingopyxis sp. JAI128 TaxID=2723066 RepID=UPI00160FCB18|nr:hypothetical protein [Sphingopyxis sp. JAI128]MBB6424630.1 hypothetical protein [Sphingopyxis sp. JAI128]
MNAQKWSPPPTLQNFLPVVNVIDGATKAVAQMTFAYGLFIAARELRINEPLQRVVLQAARTTVLMLKHVAERGWDEKGFPVSWSEADYEAIADQMAKAFPRDKAVAVVVEGHLERERERVFFDTSLTHGDEHFAIFRATFPQDCLFSNEEYVEPPISTIGRSLDYIEDMMKIKQGKLFIMLRRELYILFRVYTVVIAP